MAHENREGLLTKIGTLTSRPSAFIVVGAYALAWVLLSPDTLNWHGVATLATWLMTLFIQRAEHRDTQGLHAKLDELLRSDPRARDGMALIDENEPETIERIRDREQQNVPE
jgi:low affinity Fe/Cu permease